MIVAAQMTNWAIRSSARLAMYEYFSDNLSVKLEIRKSLVVEIAFEAPLAPEMQDSISPFQFFSTLRFFREKFFPQRVPLHFLLFYDRMDVGKSQSVPPFSFFGTVIYLSENKKIFPLQFFDVLRQNG